MDTDFTPVSERFHAALAYASALHALQHRKGSTIPYVAHLLAVASIVMEAGGTEDEAIAALLHDGPEDQGGLETLHAIGRRFGSNVAEIVKACSDTFETPKPAWPERKAAYVTRLHKADRSTLLVSASDKLHNARQTLHDLDAVGDPVWKRFSADRAAILGNYLNLAAAYADGATDARRDPIVKELREIVGEMSKRP